MLKDKRGRQKPLNTPGGPCRPLELICNAADLIQRPLARAVSLLMELTGGNLAEEPCAQDNFGYLFNAKGSSSCVARCSSPFWQLFPL
jgi:hypothetical protein